MHYKFTIEVKDLMQVKIVRKQIRSFLDILEDQTGLEFELSTVSIGQDNGRNTTSVQFKILF
jgi:hypothetical protein